LITDMTSTGLKDSERPMLFVVPCCDERSYKKQKK
jgi:hypothetical protein